MDVEIKMDDYIDYEFALVLFLQQIVAKIT